MPAQIHQQERLHPHQQPSARQPHGIQDPSSVALLPTRRAPLVPKDPNVHVRHVNPKDIPEYPSAHDKSALRYTTQSASSKHPSVSQHHLERPPAQPPSPTAPKTPKKRSIPREGTHSRNVVDYDYDDEGSPPQKKSRSSKGDGDSGGTSAPVPRQVDRVQNPDHQRPSTSRPSQHRHDALAPTRLPASTAIVPPLSVGSTTTKTTRIDKNSRLSAAERQEKEELKRKHQQDWRQRYALGFPKFRFYLDAVDDKTKDQVANFVTSCGGVGFDCITVPHCSRPSTDTLSPLTLSSFSLVAENRALLLQSVHTRRNILQGSSRQACTSSCSTRSSTQPGTSPKHHRLASSRHQQTPHKALLTKQERPPPSKQGCPPPFRPQPFRGYGSSTAALERQKRRRLQSSRLEHQGLDR